MLEKRATGSIQSTNSILAIVMASHKLIIYDCCSYVLTFLDSERKRVRSYITKILRNAVQLTYN